MEEKIKRYCKEKYKAKKTIVLGKSKTNMGRTLYFVEMIVTEPKTYTIRKYIDEKIIERY